MRLKTVLLFVFFAIFVDAKDSLRTISIVKILDKNVSNISIDDNGIGKGFLGQYIEVGPLGAIKNQEIPYQIQSISKEVIQNQQAQGLEDIIKYNPSVQIETRGGEEVGRPQTRGFRSDVVSNSFYDGLNVFAVTAKPLEQFEKVEFLNGIAGTLYGPQTPSGIFNFVQKRPTKNFLNEITTYYSNNENVGIHGDFGGTIDKFGYRLNLLKQGGEGYVSGSSLKRELLSVSFDYQVADNLKVETDISRYKYTKNGIAGSFIVPLLSGGYAKYALPDAVDSSMRGLGQEYAGMDLQTTTFDTKIKYSINPDLYFKAGYLFQKAERAIYGVSNSFTSNDGNYISRQSTISAPGRIDVQSWLAQFNWYKTFLGLQNKIAFGLNGYQFIGYSNPLGRKTTLLGTANINKPVVYPSPIFLTNSDKYQSSKYFMNNFVIGDNIKFNNKWSTIWTVSESFIKHYSYKSDGDKTTTYDDNGMSYAFSLIYKPISTISLYTTYADSIQAGTTGANADGTTVILNPIRSKQYEFGVKAKYENIDYSAAIFQITKPIAYQNDSGIYAENGEQRNRGFEFSAAGKITENLSVLGGITYLKAQLENAKISTLSGKQVIGTAKIQYNLLFDYIMHMFDGQAGFSTNFHYTDDRPIDEANTVWAKDYYTIDVGARYITKRLVGKETTFRLSVNNVTNEKYWAGIFPAGSMDGLGLASNAGTQLFLGKPRSIMLSMSVKF